jgi:hypothetical protein
MNYQRNWVLAAYRAEHPSQRNPTTQILDRFDQTLFNRFDQELQRQADPAIPLNLFNRSILVYFANRSEAETPATRVKHAYEFFRNTMPTP